MVCSPSSTATRLCCIRCPLVACATPRLTVPSKMRLATSPMRIMPAAIIGLAASGPPDGLTTTSSARPISLRRIASWWVKQVCSSATSIGPSPTPAASAASLADGARVRSRTDSEWASMRWSSPVIQAGRSHSSAARSGDASTMAAPPSVIGAQSSRRSGLARYSPASSSAAPMSQASWALGLSVGAAAVAGGHLGHLGLGGDAGLDAGPGLEGGQLHRGGPQRGGVIGLAHAAEHPGQVAGARLAVAVHQGGVGVARADLQVRLVQRPGAVHLHVAFGHGRPGADGVQRHHKAERLPGQVVRRAGAVEVEAVVVEAHLVHRLGDHRLDQLHLAQRVLRAHVFGLGKPDDGNVAAC
jgi:hypothetical protein